MQKKCNCSKKGTNMQSRNAERKRRPQTAPTKSLVNRAQEEHERNMKLPQFETHLRSFKVLKMQYSR